MCSECVHVFHIVTLDVPAEVECYHSLFPLEPESSPTPDKVNSYICVHVCTDKYSLLHKFMGSLYEQVNQSLFGYVSTCYKAVNTKNKSHCVLRRLHGKNSV